MLGCYTTINTLINEFLPYYNNSYEQQGRYDNFCNGQLDVPLFEDVIFPLEGQELSEYSKSHDYCWKSADVLENN